MSWRLASMAYQPRSGHHASAVIFEAGSLNPITTYMLVEDEFLQSSFDAPMAE